MTRCLLVLALGLLVAGCGPSTRYRQAPSDGRPPGRYVTTPGGRLLWLPRFVTGSLAYETAVEVDTTPPQADPRLVSPPVGVPKGMETVVMLPGAFYTPASPTFLARGLTDMRTIVRVAWRMQPYETKPLLPALGHELLHCATQDANAGHQ